MHAVRFLIGTVAMEDVAPLPVPVSISQWWQTAMLLLVGTSLCHGIVSGQQQPPIPFFFPRVVQP